MQLGLIPTLFLFFGLLSIFYAAVLHYYLRDRNKVVVGHWSLGSLVLGFSVLLTINRAEVPLLLSYFVANALHFIANVEINRGLQAMTGQERPRIRRGMDLLMILTYAVSLHALHLWMPLSFREAAKTSFVCLAILVLAVQGARHCFAIYRRYGLSMARNLGLLFLAVGILWGTRILVAAFGVASNAFDQSLVNTLVYVCIFITGVARYLAFPLLLLQKAEHDKLAQFRSTLVKANKSVASSALSASIAHELNQPLAAIRINGQTLRRALEQQAQGGKINREAQAIIDDILADNERAAKIISSLRSIFMEAPSKPIPQDCASLVHKTLVVLARDMAREQIRVELDLADGLRVHISEDEFLQVMLNLLLNSLQALRGQKGSGERVIAIRLARQSDQAEIEVSDNGPGVPAHMVDMLFEILSTSKDSGMGVGLWLSKYIVERNGGQLGHAPSNLGGAAFTFTLPLVQDKLVDQPQQA